MKKNVLLFFTIVFIQCLNAQFPSNCNVPPVLQHYYERDVRHLALKRIYELQSPARDSIIIPQNYKDTIWQAMAAVFNMIDFPPRDSVFDLYCIHQAVSYYLFNKIYVKITSSCPWYQNWKNLITTTGNPALDTLLSKYGFTVASFWPTNNVATLTTNQLINVRPVCFRVATFSGVVYSEPVAPDGYGNEIYYTKTGVNRSLNFKLGFGDCYSGCIGSLTFRYMVSDDCSVQYLGSVLSTIPGIPVPNPSFCYITTYSGQMPRIWIGAISDSWNEDGNWNPFGKPILEDALIPAGIQVMPVLRDNGMNCGNLIIENGATLTILPGILLNVHGKVILKN
jgi:hypothetical protein